MSVLETLTSAIYFTIVLVPVYILRWALMSSYYRSMQRSSRYGLSTSNVNFYRFWFHLPVFLIYACFIGWLLTKFSLHSIFLMVWLIFLEFTFLRNMMIRLANVRDEFVSVSQNKSDTDLINQITTSANQAKTSYAITSFVFVITSLISFLVLQFLSGRPFLFLEQLELLFYSMP
jgi:hypothetical protein